MNLQCQDKPGRGERCTEAVKYFEMDETACEGDQVGVEAQLEQGAAATLVRRPRTMAGKTTRPEVGLGIGFPTRKFDFPSPRRLAGGGVSPARLSSVWGEQGIGDEISGF